MLSLAWFAMLAGQAQGKRKTRLPQRTFFTFVFFLFLPSVTPAPPWSIKGKAGHPYLGTTFDGSIQHNTQPSSNRALGVLSTIPSETWDLSVSRPFVPPTMNLFLVLITQAAAD